MYPENNASDLKPVIGKTLILSVFVLGMALGIVGAILLQSPQPPPILIGPPLQTAQNTIDIGNPGDIHVPPGPWGDLTATTLWLEKPETITDPSNVNMAGRTTWFFPLETQSSVTSRFTVAGIPADLLKRHESEFEWIQEADGVSFSAPAEFALSIPANAKAVIYRQLGEHPRNPRQFRPFKLRHDLVDQWLSEIGLSESASKKFVANLYPAEKLLFFSDARETISSFESEQDRNILARALSRHHSMLVQLRVRPNDDIEALASYWGRNGRQSEVHAILSSLAQQQRGGSIDITHLLPATPRRLLNTYPDQISDQHPDTLNCCWTSLNFFSRAPEERFIDLDEFHKIVVEGDAYSSVTGAFTFGDLVYFVNPTGEPLHTAVYLAGGIVISKNGYGSEIPWSLTTLEELRLSYQSPLDGTPKIYGFRKNGT